MVIDKGPLLLSLSLPRSSRHAIRFGRYYTWKKSTSKVHLSRARNIAAAPRALVAKSHGLANLRYSFESGARRRIRASFSIVYSYIPIRI